MERPRDLQEISLMAALPLRRGVVTMTMSEGQWDAVLAEAYATGFTLLELDEDEKPVRAYRKAVVR